MLPTEMVARKPRAQVPYCGRFTGQSASCSGSCRQPARYQGRAVSTGSRAGKMTDNPIILGGCGLARHDGELRGKGIAPVVSHFNQDQGWLCGTAEAVDCGATFAWLGNFRRLAKDVEVLTAIGENFVRIAMLKITLTKHGRY